MQTRNGLIVVDTQKSFVPIKEWGTWELWVEWGWSLAPMINNLMLETKNAWWLVIATRDWHPSNHMSFASQYQDKEVFDSLDSWQILWPDHCIAWTNWAEYVDDLDTSLIDHHVIKWYKQDEEMYSWFAGKEMRKDDEIVTITELLKWAWIWLVKVVGLATDFCVNATALDALKNGFDVEVIKKAIAWVNPSESVKRLEELREKWALIKE